MPGRTSVVLSRLGRSLSPIVVVSVVGRRLAAGIRPCQRSALEARRQGRGVHGCAEVEIKTMGPALVRHDVFIEIALPTTAH
eukprot:2559310-Pyramimonas_sp.AAC.1